MSKTSALTRRAAALTVMGTVIAFGSAVPAFAGDGSKSPDGGSSTRVDQSQRVDHPSRADRGGRDDHGGHAPDQAPPRAAGDASASRHTSSPPRQESSPDRSSGDGSSGHAVGDTHQPSGLRAAGGGNSHPGDDATTHVRLCHATGSSTNPYVLIDPTADGAYNGHYRQHGDDIIPPFVFHGVTYSLNYPAEKAIFDDGCRVSTTAGGGNSAPATGGTDSDTDTAETPRIEATEGPDHDATAGGTGTLGTPIDTDTRGAGDLGGTGAGILPVLGVPFSGHTPVTLAGGGFGPTAPQSASAPQSGFAPGAAPLPLTAASGGTAPAAVAGAGAGMGVTAAPADSAVTAGAGYASDQLPFTGADTAGLVLSAFGLLGAGGLSIQLARRRSRRGPVHT